VVPPEEPLVPPPGALGEVVEPGALGLGGVEPGALGGVVEPDVPGLGVEPGALGLVLVEPGEVWPLSWSALLQAAAPKANPITRQRV
jgi:hypothetical protein